MGYGELARVTGFPFHEYDEGTTEEIAREPDYREHRDCDERDADDRCDDCQRKPEDRAAAEKPDRDDDDDDDDYDYDYEYDEYEDDARAVQDAAVDDDVDGPGDTDDDAEDGSCARPRCRCPRKFLVSRAIETLVAEATVARLLLNRC